MLVNQIVENGMFRINELTLLNMKMCCLLAFCIFNHQILNEFRVRFET